MNRTSLLNRSVFAALLLSVSASVFAALPMTVQPQPQPVAAAAPSTNADAATSSQGKTRAEVRAELVQAQEAGFLPIHNDYPPSAEAIARNRARFQLFEPAQSTTTMAEQ